MPSPSPGLIVVGLGPGGWDSLTLAAARALEAAAEIYVPSARHPAVDALHSHLPGLAVHSLEKTDNPELPGVERYERMAAALLELARRPTGAVYAVPGNPQTDDPSMGSVLRRFTASGVPVEVIAGVSLTGQAPATAAMDGSAWVEVLRAEEIERLAAANAVGETPGGGPPVPWRSPMPTAPLLVTGLEGRSLRPLQRWLCRYYPEDLEIELQIKSASEGDRHVTVSLAELSAHDDGADWTSLRVPALTETENVRTFAGLMQLTRTLRAPGGCPWDREQTHATLKPHLVEEAYEVVDALDSGDPALIAEELGDLLFQVTIHSQVAAEAGTFTVEDVVEGITRKLIGRHPHVFGDVRLGSAQEVRHVWEALKQREKPKRDSIMAEIPRGLPALPQSNLMQKRAASVGFEWPGVTDVLAKVEEEIGELEAEIEAGAAKEVQREELGDILFALVSVARHLKLDPEEALRLANRKFAARFKHVETAVAAGGRTLRDLSPAELDGYWQAAKEAAVSS